MEPYYVAIPRAAIPVILFEGIASSVSACEEFCLETRKAYAESRNEFIGSGTILHCLSKHKSSGKN